MSVFKVGDKVRVVNVSELFAPAETVGMVGEVIRGDGEVQLDDGSCWFYADEELELVEDEEEAVEEEGDLRELEVLAGAVGALSALDPDAQRRVIQYLADRFDVII